MLKNRLKAEGSELVTKCNQLKMLASDGKLYLADTVDTNVMLQLVQSISSSDMEVVLKNRNNFLWNNLKWKKIVTIN